MPAAGASVAADTHQQRPRSPTLRDVGQSPDHAVTSHPLAAAAAAPALTAVLGIEHPTGQDGSVGFEVLADDLEPEVIEPAELGQVRAVEATLGGSVAHVEVFRDERVGTFILGRPRRLPRDRRASARYTLICEEPPFGRVG